jgi:CheY-like chemotaxis protein
MARILIVDDSIVMRKNLATIIRQAGHVIAGEASNGRQAVTQYVDLKPDVVTMDISMPIMSGVEAVKQIIKIDSNAKIIMISAVNQKKMVFNAINNGAKHYVVKPIDAKKVISIINEVLSEDEQLAAISVIDSRDTTQGFQIENVDGAFIITFNAHIGTKDHNFLDMAIRGIMFIKPLTVVMDFSNLPDIHPTVLGPIIKLANEIKAIDGTLSYKTSNEIIASKIANWE